MQSLQLLDAEAAKAELAKKSLLDIERATAITWGGRAAAAYMLANRAHGAKRAKWLSDAENYRQETLEHAAMTEDLDFLKRILGELEVARKTL